MLNMKYLTFDKIKVNDRTSFSEKLSVFRAIMSCTKLTNKTCVKLLFCGNVLFFKDLLYFFKCFVHIRRSFQIFKYFKSASKFKYKHHQLFDSTENGYMKMTKKLVEKVSGFPKA